MSDQEIKHDGTMSAERSSVVRWKVCKDRADHGMYNEDACPMCEFERVKDQPIPVFRGAGWVNRVTKEQADRLVENAKVLCNGILPGGIGPFGPGQEWLKNVPPALIQQDLDNARPVLTTNQPPKLQPFQERVVEELQQVNHKIEKLDEFTFTLTYENLDFDERYRMTRQLFVMREYAKILAERVLAFKS